MTRDKILEAARDLFQEKGFDLTSVREIAAKAGVNVALINYHFGSKENLLLDIFETASSATRLKVSNINSSDATPEEKLSQVISMYVDKIMNNCKSHQFIHHEMGSNARPELTDNLMKILGRNSAELRKLFEDGQRKKIFRKDADVELVMATLFGVMYQTTHAVFRNRYRRTGESDDVFKARVEAYLNTLLAGYLIK